MAGFFKKLLPVAGAVGGAILGGPGGAAVGAVLGGALGGNNKAPAMQAQLTGSNKSGFQTLPPELQQAYMQYLSQIQAQSQGPYNAGPMGQAETGPYASQGLQQLQQHFNKNGSPFAGGNGAMPLGVVEPFHPYQTQAFDQIGQGSNATGLEGQLRPYMDLYNKYVLNPTLERNQRERQVLENSLTGAGAGNLGYQHGSALATQRGALERNYGELEQEAQANAFDNALGLRRQGLGDLLTVGGAVQNQGQQYLNALQPHLQAALPQNRTARLGQALGLIPGESPTNFTQQWHQPPTKPSWGEQFAGLATSLGGLAGNKSWGDIGSLFTGGNNGGGQSSTPTAGSIGFQPNYQQPPQLPAGFGSGYGGYGGINRGNRGFNPAFGYR
jgi:hypothetical protein